MKHLGELGSESATSTDPPASLELSPPAAGSAERSALPPLADVVSREVRRIGRAWKIEGVKSLIQVVLTMLVMTVLGAGWLIFFAVATGLGWYLWSTFSVKATMKPYQYAKRRTQGDEENVAAGNASEEYAEWLVGPENATE